MVLHMHGNLPILPILGNKLPSLLLTVGAG